MNVNSFRMLRPYMSIVIAHLYSTSSKTYQRCPWPDNRRLRSNKSVFNRGRNTGREMTRNSHESCMAAYSRVKSQPLQSYLVPLWKYGTQEQPKSLGLQSETISASTDRCRCVQRCIRWDGAQPTGNYTSARLHTGNRCNSSGMLEERSD